MPTDYDDVTTAVLERPSVHSSAVVVAFDWGTGKHFGVTDSASAVVRGCIPRWEELGAGSAGSFPY